MKKGRFTEYEVNKLSKLDYVNCVLVSQQVYQFLRILNFEYPNFKKWYWSLFDKQGNLLPNREILYCKSKYSIVAVSILKFELNEKKICTFRVHKNYQGQGIGKLLMEKSFEYLQTDKPLITLHKSKQKQFEKLFNYYNFKQEQSLKNYYKYFSTELSFNGILPQKSICLNKFNIEDVKKALIDFLDKNKFENVDQLLEAFILSYFGEVFLKKYKV